MADFNIEYGGAPGGLFSIVGFQPPLNEGQTEAVETAMHSFLEKEHRGFFLGTTKMIERVPDEGERYTEFQAEPLQLHDDRAEAIGHRIVPDLVKCAGQALADHSEATVKVWHGSTSVGKTLFGGSMRVWYLEGRDPLPEPHPPIIESPHRRVRHPEATLRPRKVIEAESRAKAFQKIGAAHLRAAQAEQH
jgi:hypothetical protein